METIAISKFKAQCLAILADVQKTGKPVLVTKFGKPVAEINPPKEAKPKKRKLGWGIGTGEILCDPDELIAPVYAKEEWEMFRD